MHRNLFVAILIHVVLSLIVNVDQVIAWATGDDVGGGLAGASGTIYETVNRSGGLGDLSPSSRGRAGTYGNTLPLKSLD